MSNSDSQSDKENISSNEVSAQTQVAIERQKKVWNRRVSTWEHHGVLGLEKVINAVLDLSQVQAGMQVLDIGCGTGTLALPMAKSGALVTAIDVSPAMIDRLMSVAREQGISGIKGIAAPAETLNIEAKSIDIIVSNYALHHLRDSDKEKLVKTMFDWLKPGGKVVIGDMMVGRGGTSRDREIIASKISIMLKKGPAGWWRILKNAMRYFFRVQERPISMEAWTKLFESNGYVEVAANTVINEAATIMAKRPI
ncbi:MAG: class I SAM-dependent methyltransferase [Acidimicrobiales bacterium]|nr:class I SAM-dependent methyltransferase [Acidimicrobiales bacterium]